MEEVKVNISFGEYANPSFESQVETISKGKQGGIMSIEASVEELYGDSKDDDWKKEEVSRLKAEQGIAELEEPGINMDGGGTLVKGLRKGEQISDESQSGKSNVPDGQDGI